MHLLFNITFHVYNGFSASHDQTVMVWAVDLDTLAVKCVQVGRGHERSVECVGVDSSSSMIATGGWDKFLKIWAAGIFIFHISVAQLLISKSFRY